MLAEDGKHCICECPDSGLREHTWQKTVRGGGAVRRVDEGWTRGCEEQIGEVADITSGGSAGTSIAAEHGILFITYYKKVSFNLSCLVTKSSIQI